MEKYDLIVVGGGFAGVASALSARRNGAKVLLVEKSNCLGGAATNCLVNPFMQYWTYIDEKRVDLSNGIFKEICEGLESMNALKYSQSFLEEELKLLLNQMLEEAGVDILFHAYLSKVNKADKRINSLVFLARGGEIELFADYYIDATGDAQLAYLADCPTLLGRENDNLCQPMTLCFRVGNVDTEAFYKSNSRLQEEYAKGLKNGEISIPRENILVFSTPIKNVLHFNTTRVVKKNPTDPFDFSEAEIIARKQVFEIYDFVKKHAGGMENSFLMATASEIGVRESRKIIGDYVLTEKDCKNCTKFDDAIACCNYEIDIHNPEGIGTSLYYFKKGEFYTIPYRALIPKGVDNMLVAGRCISSDHASQASYRIMPTVCAIGQGAGTAIAQAIAKGVTTRQIDIKELQYKLVKDGAFLKI